MEKRTVVAVAPGQAQWIVERLIADRRISAADVRSLLSDLAQEIRAIEQRLFSLRNAAGPTPVAAPAPRSEAPAAKYQETGRPAEKGPSPRYRRHTRCFAAIDSSRGARGDRGDPVGAWHQSGDRSSAECRQEEVVQRAPRRRLRPSAVTVERRLTM